MRKIVSRSQIKKSQQKKQLIAGMILVGLMIFSTIAYSFMSRDSDPNTQDVFLYNGIAFVQNQEYFVGSASNFQIILINNPKLNDLPVEKKLNHTISNFYSFPLYIDSEDYLATSIISQNLGNQINGIAQRVQLACFDENDCEEEFPIKDCSENLIVVRYSNESKIESIENCVFIYGKEGEMSLVVDKFILELFSI